MKIKQIGITGVRNTVTTQTDAMIVALCEDGSAWVTSENVLRGNDGWTRLPEPQAEPSSSLVDKLCELQREVRAIREDYRGIDDRHQPSLDARLNYVESEIGEMVSEARGEGDG